MFEYIEYSPEEYFPRRPESSACHSERSSFPVSHSSNTRAFILFPLLWFWSWPWLSSSLCVPVISGPLSAFSPPTSLTFLLITSSTVLHPLPSLFLIECCMGGIDAQKKMSHISPSLENITVSSGMQCLPVPKIHIHRAFLQITKWGCSSSLHKFWGFCQDN